MRGQRITRMRWSMSRVVRPRTSWLVKPRTIEDNEKEMVGLKTPFEENKPLHVVGKTEFTATYRDEAVAPIRANRELSLLRPYTCGSWKDGYAPRWNVNPLRPGK